MVFDLDDLCDEFDPWDALHALKGRFPNLKVTLFAIPGRCSQELLARYREVPWVELGVHGYHHSSVECAAWTYEETSEKLDELEALGWPKLFKAPGWFANQQVYQAVHDKGWLLADHLTQAWLGGHLPMRRYMYQLSDRAIHGHTWDVMGNGPSDWESMFAHVGEDEEFAFVSEAVREINWHYTYHPDQDEFSSWSHKSVFGQQAAKRLSEMVSKIKPECLADFGGNDGYALSTVGVPERWVIDGDPARALHASRAYGLKSACVNLEKLPFEDNYFEWGFCSHTLEHVENLEDAWGEIKRTVKKGCWVIVPVESQDEFDKNPAHLRRHTHEEWIELLGLEEVSREDNELTGLWVKE